MGYEDRKLKAIADKKAVFACLIGLVLCIALYLPGKISSSLGPQRISQFERESEKRKLEIHAVLRYQEEVYETDTELTVQAMGHGEQEEPEESLQTSFLPEFSEKLFRRLSKDSSGAALILPKEQDGVVIEWSIPKEEAPTWVFGIYIIIALLLWFSRYDSLKNKKKADKEALLRELPSAIFQLCLLLNAGLMVDSAFSALTERNAHSDSVLSKCFIWLKIKAEESNSSFVEEMYGFSKDFGNREFLRFATLCMENLHHGSELSSKLEAERSRLWDDRLLTAKAAAKEAETKLCFPLMLMLIALLIICTIPAMSGM